MYNKKFNEAEKLISKRYSNFSEQNYNGVEKLKCKEYNG